MDSFLDECPICYNPYCEPKGIPCFHTFCRECLQTHINNSRDGLYFNCPMCQKRTVPFGDKCIPVSQWAKSFPTNNFVLNQNLEIAHKQCPSHQNEILDINCKSCRVMICCQCCLSSHEKCEKTLTKFNAKRIKKNLVTYREKLKVTLEPLENRLGKLDDEKESTATQIKQMALDLTDYIRNQEQFWLQEIEVSHLREGSALQEQREDLVQMIELAEQNIQDFDNLFGEEEPDEGSKSRSTYEYQPRHALMSMKKTDLGGKEGEVNFQINPNFVKLKDGLLKETMVEKLETPASPQTVDATSEIENRLLIKEFSVGSETLVGINDMVMLPDQSFMITEACFKKLWKFSTVGHCVRDIYFDSEPYGLCLLRDNCVAISQPYDRKISIFDCGNLNEKDSFSFDKRYYGLGSDDNEKIFALYRDQSMYVDIISKGEGGPSSPYEIFDTIKLPTMFYFCDDYRLRVLPTGHVLIINSVNSLNVACINQDGELAFRYQGDSDNCLFSIADLAVGRNFIYVADKSTNTIHRIRHDGSFVDVPLTPNDGISQPKKIFVNSEEVLSVLSKTNQNPKIQLFPG